jgi:oxygen-independent coproporphyrinogen III oxidase
VKTPTTDIANAVEPPVLPRAAYVHVPFCRHRCGYCDFALIAGRDDLIADYLAAIQRELTRLDAGPCLGLGNPPLELSTLYLGGGTPSHLGPDGLTRLFHILHARLRPLPGAEVTIEANPQDVTEALAVAAAACGTTRVSLGAQSLDATTLAALDRDHTPDDVPFSQVRQ